MRHVLARLQAAALRNLQLPGLFALDLNSRFETAPGVKDAGRLDAFFQALKAEQPTVMSNQNDGKQG